MTDPQCRRDLCDSFWRFLAYLQKYLEIVADLDVLDNDPGRTRLLSHLADNLRPVLRAQTSFVGILERSAEEPMWIQIVRDTVQPVQGEHLRARLFQRLEASRWRAPYRGFDLGGLRTPAATTFFNQRLADLPLPFRDAVTALALAQVEMLDQHYFMFFCDLSDQSGDMPRYTTFDTTMLRAAAGILEVGFRSGVRGGRRAQHILETAEKQRFLAELVHGLKTPIQTILADADNLHSELAPDMTDLLAMSQRVLSAGRHLNMVVDTLWLALSDAELPDEPITEVDVGELLQKAVALVQGQASLRGLEIRAPRPADAHPFPHLPVRPLQVAVAFENVIHNAVTYSLPGPNGLEPIRIEGHYEGDSHYVLDFTNVGLPISPDDIATNRLFAFGYRGDAARQMAPGGSGVGLSSVQRIAQRHGGAIQVTSEPLGQGLPLNRNTFRLVLPVSRARSQG